MITLNFDIDINATPERIWDALWKEENYRKWTRPFSPDSQLKKESWNEGASVWFTDGKGNGISSMVAIHQPNEQMSFRHLYEIKDGLELKEEASRSEWYGAMEQYFVSETATATNLAVSVDTTEEHTKHFEDAFPKALQLVKQMSES